MKKNFILVLVLILCMTAAVVQADDLSDVIVNGVLRMGTSPEYVPFVLYEEDGTMTGIDVELIKEIGHRMGVEVRTVAVAFEKLPDALNSGQVDIIGRGMSRTESRMEKIGFSRLYYKNQAQFVGLKSLAKPAEVDHGSFKGLKIGVEKATCFEEWIRDNLVKEGIIGENDVKLYSSYEDVADALNRKEVDLVVLDQDVYELLYRPAGEYQVFYDGFLEEDFAFGLRKGSTLTAEINRHLTDMLKDGTAQKIAAEFFLRDYLDKDKDEKHLKPIPTLIPTAVSVKDPSGCINSMKYSADVTVSDGQKVYPGENFRKVWLVTNSGTCTWEKGYSLAFVSGEQMRGGSIAVSGPVAPGQTIEIAAEFVAPSKTGVYEGTWQMRSPQGVNFGETVWVKISVEGSAPADDQTDPGEAEEFDPADTEVYEEADDTGDEGWTDAEDDSAFEDVDFDYDGFEDDGWDDAGDDEWTEADDGEWTEADDGEWTEAGDEEWTEADDEEWTEADDEEWTEADDE